MADLSAAAELRRKRDVIAPATQRAPEERLAEAVAIDVRGVEERHLGVQRGVDDGTRRVLVDAAPEVVAAEADHRDLERPERALPHRARV